MDARNLEAAEPPRLLSLELSESPPLSYCGASMVLPARYAYRSELGILVWMTACFSWDLALHFYLSKPSDVAWFAGLIAAGTYGSLILLGLFAILHRLFGPRHLELREDGILLPYERMGFKLTFFPFAKILKAKQIRQGSGKSLVLMTEGHRTIVVIDGKLPSRQVFEDISALVAARVGQPAFT
jgi:hypothetical protein